MPNTLKSVVGYVGGSVELPRDHTVQQLLTFHARLRMPTGTRTSAVRERVASVAQRCGLTGLLKTRINVHGGDLNAEAKVLLMIALELTAAPSVLILNNPTK